MRIIYITPYVPSPIRVRSFNLIKGLAALGHAVTVVALSTGQDDADVESLQSYCEKIERVPLSKVQIAMNLFTALWTDEPLQAAYGRSPKAVLQIERILSEEHYDVAHVEHLRASIVGRAIQGLPKVYDSVDCISLLFERAMARSPQARTRWMARFELSRTRCYEGLIGDGYERIIITSAEDRMALQNLMLQQGVSPPDDCIRVLPNGIDLDYFAPMPLERRQDTLVFSGKMSYHANIATALYLGKEIMPRVWKERPGAQLWIVGKDPPDIVRDLSRDDRVTVTGYVPDLRPYLAQATLSVSPMAYGVGIQNKILEAMALATPVVTGVGAIGSLAALPGRDLLAGETTDDLVEAILSLLADAERRRQIGESGRQYIETCHDIRVIAADLAGIYREAIGRFTGSAIRPADGS
ncbi:MAG: glycosyltransferase [Anaerolineae bacterium]|jgi:glycosyltransferase involved in cell wall biosynthesis